MFEVTFGNSSSCLDDLEKDLMEALTLDMVEDSQKALLITTEQLEQPQLSLMTEYRKCPRSVTKGRRSRLIRHKSIINRTRSTKSDNMIFCSVEH